MNLYVLNAPVLTSYGSFTYTPLRLEAARTLLKDSAFVSAVGHEAASALMTRILGIDIPVSRIRVKMVPGDFAVVFRPLVRQPEGKILTESELAELPFEFGLLSMGSVFRHTKH